MVSMLYDSLTCFRGFYCKLQCCSCIVVNIVDTLKSVWCALQAFGGMFCLSGLLGMYGSCVTLAGFCMARHFATSGISVFKIKVSAAHVPWCKAQTCCTEIFVANTCMALFLRRHNTVVKGAGLSTNVALRHVYCCCTYKTVTWHIFRLYVSSICGRERLVLSICVLSRKWDAKSRAPVM